MRKIIASLSVCIALLFVASQEVFAAEPPPLPGDEPGTAVVAPAAAPINNSHSVVNAAKSQPEPKHGKAAKAAKKGGRNEAHAKKATRNTAAKSKSATTKPGKPAAKSHAPAGKSKKRR